jgi:uncharacterized protein (TIGR03086 family)
MSDTVEMWKRVADGFDARVRAVGPDQWAATTPCEGWDVNALVEHTIGAQRMVPKALGASGDIDAEYGSDPVGVWSTVRAAAEGALTTSDLSQTIDLPFGSMPAEQGLGIPLGDLLIHTWDLARSIGADEQLDDQACATVLESLEPIDAMIRQPGIFGPKLDVAPGATAQDRLLAFTGRKA